MKSAVNGITRTRRAQFLSQFGPAGQRGQLGGVVAGTDLHRMRIEGHQDGRHTAGASALDGVRDQSACPRCTPSNTDRQYASAPVRGDVVLSPPPLHGSAYDADAAAPLPDTQQG